MNPKWNCPAVQGLQGKQFEIKRIGAGMLGVHWEGIVDEVSGVEMKRKSKVPKLFFCLPQKRKKNNLTYM